MDLGAACTARLAKCTPGTVTIYGYLFAGSVSPDGVSTTAAAENLGVLQVFLAVGVRGRCVETSILILLSFFIKLGLFVVHTLYLFLNSTEASGVFRGSSLLEAPSRPTCQSET